jgi:flagellar motility protein MotE (MotC chaperone)
VRRTPARTLAAAGTAGAGVAAAAVAYLEVGGLPGVLYAAGICVAAFFGAVALIAGRTEDRTEDRTDEVAVEPETGATPAPPRWRRKKHVIAELEGDLAATSAELEEHRRALANLATQLTRESEAAQQSAERLESRIKDLEAERDSLNELVAQERERFERTLDDLGGGIGRHGNELAELERELEALIAR